MSTPDTERLRRLTDGIGRGIGELDRAIEQIGNAVAAATAQPGVPPPVRDTVRELGDWMVTTGRAVLQKVEECVRGIDAPVVYFQDAYQWGTVRGTAGGVAGQLRPDVLAAGWLWHGRAAAAYQRATALQDAAAVRLTTLADKTESAVGLVAISGATFYTALGVILVQAAGTLLAAAATVPVGPLALAGWVAAAADLAVTQSAVIAACTALTASLAVQAEKVAAIHGEAVDTTAFPGGHWPDPVTATYADATVRDGDADWSLRS